MKNRMCNLSVSQRVGLAQKATGMIDLCKGLNVDISQQKSHNFIVRTGILRLELIDVLTSAR